MRMSVLIGLLICSTVPWAQEPVQKDAVQSLAAVRWVFKGSAIPPAPDIHPEFISHLLAEGKETLAYYDGKTLHLLRKADGKKLWSRAVASKYGIELAVFNDLVIAGGENPEGDYCFHALDPQNGKEKEVPLSRIRIRPDLGIRRIGEALYFSFITGLTIGYGDIVVNTPFARLVAVLLGLIGMITSGIMVAASIRAVERNLEELGLLKQS